MVIPGVVRTIDEDYFDKYCFIIRLKTMRDEKN